MMTGGDSNSEILERYRARGSFHHYRGTENRDQIISVIKGPLLRGCIAYLGFFGLTHLSPGKVVQRLAASLRLNGFNCRLPNNGAHRTNHRSSQVWMLGVFQFDYMGNMPVAN